jgi:hypothetical protein
MSVAIHKSNIATKFLTNWTELDQQFIDLLLPSDVQILDFVTCEDEIYLVYATKYSCLEDTENVSRRFWFVRSNGQDIINIKAQKDNAYIYYKSFCFGRDKLNTGRESKGRYYFVHVFADI